MTGIKLNNITYNEQMEPLYKGIDIGITFDQLYKFIEKPNTTPINSDIDAQKFFDKIMEELYNQSPVVIRDKKINDILCI